jgi:hypothetical protein
VARTGGDLDHHNTIALATVPISLIKIVRLTFTTDHAVMLSHDTDWVDFGIVANKPEWSTGSPSAAVSHSKDKLIGISADFEVVPSNADPVSCAITGLAAFGSLTFTGSAIFQGGTVRAKATTSPIKLKPDSVELYHGDVRWVIGPDTGPEAGGAGWSAGSSEGHTIYVTMDTPAAVPSPEDGVTRKRMDAAVQLVKGIGTEDPHGIVQGLMDMVPGYTLIPNPEVPEEFKHPSYFNGGFGGAWPICDFSRFKAQCQAIVRWVRAVIKTVGCPGTADLVTIWADPLIDNGQTTQMALNDPDQGLDSTAMVHGRPCAAVLVDRYPVEGQVYDVEEKTDRYIGVNRYEACLRFTQGGKTKFYGGGAGTYDSADEVLMAFYALAWMTPAGTNANGKHIAMVVEVVRRWRDAQGNLL